MTAPWPRPAPHPSRPQPPHGYRAPGGAPHGYGPSGQPGYAPAAGHPAPYAYRQQPYPSGYRPPYRQQAPPRRRPPRRWPWLGLGLAGTLLLAAALGTGPGPDAEPTAPAAAVAGGHAVTYQVTGGERATSVSWTAEGSRTERVTGVDLPFGRELPLSADINAFAGLTLVAQNGDDVGDISCRILVDGHEIATSTAWGRHAVVTCTGAAV